MNYRHFSFDVWLTLLRTNPTFRHQRTAYFAQHFNPLGRSLGQVDQAIQEVDSTCTRINELVGKQIDALEMILLMAQRLGSDLHQLTPERLLTVQDDINTLFHQHPPQWIDEQLPNVLSTLRGRGMTLSVLSNTGMIRGNVLRQCWEKLGVNKLFSFQLYSDELGLSKPNSAFYAVVYQQAQQLPEYQLVSLQPSSILHIGDNPVADQAGARAAQFSTQLVDPNRPRFAELLL